jgi:hypothetical protein
MSSPLTLDKSYSTPDHSAGQPTPPDRDSNRPLRLPTQPQGGLSLPLHGIFIERATGSLKK